MENKGTVVIRPYEGKDFPQIVKLGQQFQAYLVAIDGSGLTLNLDDKQASEYAALSLKDIREKEGSYFIAVNEAGDLVGFICGIIERQPSTYFTLTHSPEIQGWIGELFVTEEYRSQGVGRSLVEKIEAYFKENGCTACWLKVADNNLLAQDFYDKADYFAREIEMRKSL